MSKLAQTLAGFVVKLAYDDIPECARHAAVSGITDTVATMIAGRNEQAPRLVASMVSSLGTNSGALNVVDQRILPPEDSALINSTAAHVLDYDDVALSGHPSVVLAPVILALGQTVEVTGKEAICAYVAGYETWAHLDKLKTGQLHDIGLHPTAVMGTIAAAAAASLLLGLSDGQTATALALSASMASGLTANFGTMTKSFQVGRAAQAGIQAATLAKHGFTAAWDALDHPRGFIYAISSQSDDTGAIAKTVGSDWHLAQHGVNIKRYPVCYATHRSIDAMLDIVNTHKITPEDVTEINVCLGSTQHRMLRNARPQTALEARFSIEFALAAALVSGRVSLAELDDDYVASSIVQEQFDKIRIITTDETMPGDETFAPEDSVSLNLRNGSILTTTPVIHARGSWRNPMSTKELATKFYDCVASVLCPQTAKSLFLKLQELATITDIQKLNFPSESVSWGDDRNEPQLDQSFNELDRFSNLASRSFEDSVYN